MIVEKLLLHVLIVLAPVLIHSLFFSHRPIGRPSFFVGILHGLTGSLCILFAYESFGLYWDLRYVPLILAFLYGGMRGGFTALGLLLAARIYAGGEALVFGIFSAFIAAIGPVLISAKFNRYEWKWKRLMWAMLAGVWTVFVQLLILIGYLNFSDGFGFIPAKLLYFVAVFGLIQITGAGFAALLHEASMERFRMQEKIFRAEKLNTLGEMAASIAHEVRNPLTVVKGFLQLMQADDRQGKFPYLPLVLSELDRAEAIISDYLNFAKPKLEKMEVFDLGEFLDDMVQLLNPLSIKKSVALTGKMETGIQIRTDRNKLRQAVINLMKNAIEATPPGGRVSVTLSAAGTEAEIKISDTGKGMTTEQLARIGSLYYSTKEEGTGLGTMVSLSIIEAMGGKTVYASQPGVGTEVKVFLKRNESHGG
ncbi:two-component sensor histidine kinase [Bacillus mangrovi]|uniref:histidine kinase n=1 Tax=Metabacillus mangrovi TaxID=1491830 RepID=A0A7X2V4Z8_9BACI|nr:ATP-binding protein [Metabacillus mangrovi]MTH53624.1 two-component sensor histidine kinase [Metabacillus mangrovi]